MVQADLSSCIQVTVFFPLGVQLASKTTKKTNKQTNKKQGRPANKTRLTKNTYIDLLLKRNGSSSSNLCQCHYCTYVYYHFCNHIKVDGCLVIFISQFYTHGQIVDYILGIRIVYFNLNHKCVKQQSCQMLQHISKVSKAYLANTLNVPSDC